MNQSLTLPSWFENFASSTQFLQNLDFSWPFRGHYGSISCEILSTWNYACTGWLIYLVHINSDKFEYIAPTDNSAIIGSKTDLHASSHKNMQAHPTLCLDYISEPMTHFIVLYSSQI